ncbi:MAG: FMN-binding protein [Lentisphaerae bacterium]|nr:FMN-binding protein [Lentisphaerota bacterium]
MKKISKTRTRLFTVFFMFIVTFVSISAVSALHLTSRDRVARNEKLYLMQGIWAAAGLTLPAGADEIAAWFAASVTPRPGAEAPIFYEVRESADGARRAMIFVRQGKGLWGKIDAVVGVDPSLSHFTGIAFVNHNETPGLGARIMEPWYGEQIKHKTGGLTLVPEGSGSTDPTELDAITGATITSKGVRDILNSLIEEAPALVASLGRVTEGPDHE